MKKIFYRVEVNYGSKYFSNAIKATAFMTLCRLRKQSAELWLYVIEDNPKLYSVKQELLDWCYPQDKFPSC